MDDPTPASPRLFTNRFAADAVGRGPARTGEVCFRQPNARVRFHRERQDATSPGWQRMLELIKHLADDRLLLVCRHLVPAGVACRSAECPEVNEAAVLCVWAERVAAVAVRTESVQPLRDALVAVGLAVFALNDDRDHLYRCAAVDHSAALLGTTFASRLVEFATTRSLSCGAPTALIQNHS